MGAEHRPYLAQIRTRDPDRVASEAELIRQLREHPGWALANDLIDTVHGTAVSRLLFASAGAEGRVLDQAEYARLLGFLAGLRQVRVAAEAYELHAERVHDREDST